MKETRYAIYIKYKDDVSLSVSEKAELIKFMSISGFNSDECSMFFGQWRKNVVDSVITTQNVRNGVKWLGNYIDAITLLRIEEMSDLLRAFNYDGKKVKNEKVS